MKLSWAFVAAILSLANSAVIPSELPEVTPAPAQKLSKKSQVPLGNSVWKSTLPNGAIELVTETVVDGVTISASPPSTTDSSKPTPWISLDNSGIPIAVTPTIQTPGGSTISTSPTPPASYPTPNAIPPVLRCFGDRVPQKGVDDNSVPGYPFCSPRNGTEMVVDETYWITWDPTYWGGSSIKFVKLYARFLPSKSNEDLVFSTGWVSNADGYFPLKVLSNYVIAGTKGYMFINMQPLVPQDSDATYVGAVSGPIVRMINSPSEALVPITRFPSDNSKHGKKSTSSGLSKGKLAAAIVVPIIFVLLLCSFVYFFFFVRKRALLPKHNDQTTNNGKNYGKDVYSRSKDAHLVAPTRSNASEASNISTATTATMASDMFSGPGTIGNSTHPANPFHDRHAEDIEMASRSPTKPKSTF